MSASRQITGLEQAQLPGRPLHLAIGMFDGVHLGHRAVIDTAIQSARRSGGLAAVLTFWPHPSELFRPQEPTRLIAAQSLRERLLSETGVDVVITQPFTPEFASCEAEELLPLLKRSLPRLSTIYVGENWRFGRGRRGDIGFLVAEAKKHQLSVFSAQRINHNGEPISSTRIRRCLTDGALAEANALLGYTYFAEGSVIAGKQLGRTLGFPTLNLNWEPPLRPKYGVYAVRIGRVGEAGELFQPAVANYGVRPTVETTTVPSLEVHVLGESGLTAGEVVRVEWQTFLREERRFESLEALGAQIARDKAAAGEFFRG